LKCWIIGSHIVWIKMKKIEIHWQLNTIFFLTFNSYDIKSKIVNFILTQTLYLCWELIYLTSILINGPERSVVIRLFVVCLFLQRGHMLHCKIYILYSFLTFITLTRRNEREKKKVIIFSGFSRANRRWLFTKKIFLVRLMRIFFFFFFFIYIYNITFLKKYVFKNQYLIQKRIAKVSWCLRTTYYTNVKRCTKIVLKYN
jgi:hypothetical protein